MLASWNDSLKLALSPRSVAMTRFLLFLLVLLLSVTAFAYGGNSKADSGSWSGVIVYSSCSADEAFAESSECIKNVPGAKLSLYDDTNRVVYSLEPQERVTFHPGDSVTIRGRLNGGTIRVAAAELMSIGLAVGRKAPAFSPRDQFSRTQTLDTLKGPKGTVLLFFRSADW